MASDERQALQQLGSALRKATVVLVRCDVPGRGSGLVIPWGNSVRIVTARHVIETGTWAVEAVKSTLSVPPEITEATLKLVPHEERRTLLLRLAADTRSFDASSHDIAWASLSVDHEALRNDPTEARAGSILPAYKGPLTIVPDEDEIYAFVAMNRDEYHPAVGAMVREIAAEAYMTLVREENDGFRFALARPHAGDAYYQGASGAPVADSGANIVGILTGGNPSDGELKVAGLACFIAAMKARS